MSSCFVFPCETRVCGKMGKCANSTISERARMSTKRIYAVVLYVTSNRDINEIHVYILYTPLLLEQYNIDIRYITRMCNEFFALDTAD